MNLLSALSVYLQGHFTLGASYLAFQGLRRLTARLGLGRGFAHWRLVAQCLLALSVLSPVLFAAIPRRTLPELSFRIMDPVSEVSRTRGARLDRRARFSVPEAPLAAPGSPETARFDWSWIGPALAAILILMFSIQAALSFRSLGSVRGLLARSLSIRRLGRVTIVVSDEAQVPFSIRFWRSWVVIPSHLLGLRKDFRIAVAHELQHHRQRDTLWVWLFELLRCAFQPNPFVRLWRRSITELQEFSCDEALLLRKGFSSMDYGSCLLRVAETALRIRAMHVGTTCMASIHGNPDENQSFLMRRIEMLTQLKRSRLPAWAGISLGTLAALFTLAFAYGAQQSLRNDDLDTVNPGVATFDPKIQEIAESVLRKQLDSSNAESGFALVADPQTGRILAAANLVRKAGSSPARPAHWALSQRLEPASTIKGLVAAAAVDRGLLGLGESLDCEKGDYKVGNQAYHDWKPFDHLSAAESVVQSSNICGIKVAQRLGPELLNESLRDFGLGPEGSARDFPEARPGQLPLVDNKPGSQYLPRVATGFSNIFISPLELLQAYGAIANGGLLLKPQAWDSALPAIPIRRSVSPETAEQMKGVLAEVVERGTGAEGVKSGLYTIAGKTGTGFHPDLPDHPGFSGRGSAAHFVGFAPVAHPRVLIYTQVTVSPDRQASGGKVAGPVFRRIAEQVLSLLQVAPDKPALSK